MAASNSKDSRGRFLGTSNNDSILWNTYMGKSLEVYGKSGNDILNFKKSKYKNKLDGGKGKDTIYGGTNKDTIFGGTGKDLIYGGNGNDIIYGNSGADNLHGGKGNDKIYGGSGNDIIYGDSGTNKLYGESGNDKIIGGSGTDYIYGAKGNDNLVGGKGNDIIYGEYGNNAIDGGIGNDKIHASKGNDTIYGNKGNDTIYANGKICTIHIGKTDGSDTIENIDKTKLTNLIISKSAKIITEQKGNNLLIYLAYTDYKILQKITIKKYYNNDNSINEVIADKLLINNQKVDLNKYLPATTLSNAYILYYDFDLADKFIRTSNENTILTTANANNIIYSGSGNNYIYTGNGNNIIYLSAGNDTIYSGNGNDIIYSISGKHYIQCGSGNDKIYGGSGKNIINTQDGDDTIYVGTGPATINAGSGNNIISFDQNSGNTIILNGNGTDTLQFAKGTIFKYDFNGNNLLITYNSSSTITIKDYAIGSSVKNIKIGSQTSALDGNFKYLSRGDKAISISLTKGKDRILVLKNPYNGSNYTYTLTSTNGTQIAKIQYLKNGRLVITADYTSIIAGTGQADDIILLGSNNSVDTGDKSDIIRLGYVLDSYGKYNKQTNKNKIIAGSGNDHITVFGNSNTIDGGSGNDTIYNIKSSSITIKKTETIIKDGQIGSSLDGKIGWFCQGSGAGDCRFFAVMDSLSRISNFDLSDYVKIEQTLNTYQVTFKNYKPKYAAIYNTLTVKASDIKDNVYGDLDVVVIDCALNKLLAIDNKTSVENGSYNILSEYLFGTSKTTYMGISAENKSDFEKLWNAYSTGEINNLTVGIFEDNPAQGIVGNHAYSVVDYDSTHVSLVNVWDTADILNIDNEMFFNLKVAAIGYGYDFFKQNCTFYQGYSGGVKSNTPDIQNEDIDINAIISETASWASTAAEEAVLANPDTDSFNQKIICCLQNDNLFINP